MSAASQPALAQQVPDPPPPDENPTAIVDPPPPEPEPPAAEPPAPPPEEEAPQELKHSPKDASGLDLSTLETRNVSILYFDPVQTYLTPYVGKAFENAFQYHRKMFDWEPWDRTTLLLKDFGDYGNAGARSSPSNAVLLDVAPLGQTMETFTPGERFFTLINHELAHVATTDIWNKSDARWRKFFHGKPSPSQDHPISILYNYLTVPRNNIPRWYAEGSAVFLETWMAGGLGRAQGAYDEMVFRAKVRDGDKFYSPLGLESEGTSVDFQVGVNNYLYGTRFFSYLALTYGPDKPIDWLKRPDGSAGFYASRFKQVFGKRLNQVWDDWIAFEQDFQKSNLAKLAAYPLTETRPLSPRGLGSMSRTYVDSARNQLVGAFYYPGTIGFVGTLDMATGKLRRLSDIKGMALYSVTSIAFDPDARKAYFTEDNYAFRDIVEVDVDSGKRRMLQRDARIGELVLNSADKSLWGIRHVNGFATIVRIPPPYSGFNQIHTFDYGTTVFDLDVSPDGTMVSASVGEVDGKQSVRIWNRELLESGSGPEEVARLELPPAVPEGFTFSPDSKSLYGSAYYTGVSNIVRFDIATQQFEIVSNASTGFFRPQLQPDGSLIVQEFSGQGMRPVSIVPQKQEDLANVELLGTRVVNAHPVLKEWGVGSPAKVPLDDLVTERGHYIAGKRMAFGPGYPIIMGYKGSPALGYLFHWEDPMQFNQLTATVAVSPFGERRDSERFHASLEYKTMKWSLRYVHNGADFYDLFGPVERSRKGDAFIASYNHTKVYDPPRQLDLYGTAAVFLGLERLPGAQNIESPSNIFSAEAGVKYRNIRSSLGAVDREKGFAWRASAGADYAVGHVFPKIAAGLDYGVPLPISNSSAWIYLHAGKGWGTEQSPLSNFYFGAFRNNYVDNRPVKRYREMESFPGFDIDEINARSFVKATGEVNLPPIRFAEVGTPLFYLSSLRPAVFAGAMATDTADGGRRFYDVGAQLDLNFTIALRLPMVLSVGAAAGFEDGHYRATEWLVSLKIL
ncbi:MAG TPA: hypothetical protein VHN55_10025 [Sphingomicrobium sp.]|nr:hypothetical protein [Sphingomicrobium sp.]